MKNKDLEKTDLNKPQFVFEKQNYILFFIGLALILLGYVLIAGGGSEDPNVFNEKMFNFRRMTFSPLCILLGIAIEIVSVFHKTKK